MKNFKSIIIAGALSLGLIGCATTPSEESMTQLNQEQVTQLLVGNTWTNLTDWGRWAEYFGENNAGFGRAAGNFGEHDATSKYTVSEEGEVCSVYDGEYDWSDSETNYCSLVFVDANGKYYSKTTQAKKQERIGRIRNFEVRQGDHFGLSTE